MEKAAPGSSMIRGLNFNFKKFNFPCGETQINLDSLPAKAMIEFDYEGDNSEIVTLGLLCHTLKIHGVCLEELRMPYVPFSRQDRSNNDLECFSLQWFCEFINNLNFDCVEILDPHSDVTPALLKNCFIIPQHDIFKNHFELKSDFWLISPDAGSLKKIYKLAKLVPTCGVVECSKLRDTVTGEITETKINIDSLAGKDCYIVDDICDGGRTFIEIAKSLRQKYPNKIILMTTHGFYTKGFNVFDGLIDEIYDRKGRRK